MRLNTLFLATASIVVSATSMAFAAAPSIAIFKSTSHDFGTVAKAAKTEHRFEFTNPSDQPLHVRGVHASCGCTTPIVETETVLPGQTGAIIARFNTGSFSGARSATLTVSFDKPNYSELQLHVKGYIRSDVVFAPGEANFGNVNEGEGKTFNMAIDYAGRSDWAIVGIQTSDKFIKARAEETRRQSGRVGYDLQIDLLPDAPVGSLLTELIVQTNDRNLKTVPLLITANVEAGISISPRSVSLSGGEDDAPFQQVIVLKGKDPFRVTSIESDLFDIEVELSEDAKAVQAIPMKLMPKQFANIVDGKILIKTDLESMPVIELEVDYTK